MTRPVFAIRPEPGLSATLAAGLTEGLTIKGTPLFHIVPVEWEAVDPHDVDGLLLGSANAIRHGGPQLGLYRGKPAFCVGDATALAAEEAGFPVAATGRGGLQVVLDTLADSGLRLLRLAGEERVALNPPPGVTFETRTVYKSEPVSIPEALADDLRMGGVVLLHSAAASVHFLNECKRLAINRDTISLACLGPRIAAAAGEGWREIGCADEPREGALLALARFMCN